MQFVLLFVSLLIFAHVRGLFARADVRDGNKLCLVIASAIFYFLGCNFYVMDKPSGQLSYIPSCCTPEATVKHMWDYHN